MRSIEYRSMKNFDESAFLSSLSDIRWETAYAFDDVNDTWFHWESLLNQAIDHHAPLKRVSLRSNHLQWINLQKEMNEEFDLITVTISLAATAMNENNCRTATGKPAFIGVKQSMSRHVILPCAFGKEGRHSSTLCPKTFMK